MTVCEDRTMGVAMRIYCFRHGLSGNEYIGELP